MHEYLYVYVRVFILTFFRAFYIAFSAQLTPQDGLLQMSTVSVLIKYYAYALLHAAK